jgi:hypothetical protein
MFATMLKLRIVTQVIHIYTLEGDGISSHLQVEFVTGKVCREAEGGTLKDAEPTLREHTKRERVNE